MHTTTTPSVPLLPLAAALAALAAGCGDIENAGSDAAATVDPDAAATSPPDGAPPDGGPLVADGGAPDGGVTFPDDALVHLAFEGDLTDSSGNGNDAQAPLSGTFVGDRFGFAEKALSLEENFSNNFFNVLEIAGIGIRGEVTMAAWIQAGSQGNGERIAGLGEWFSLVFQSGGVGFGLTEGLNSVEPLAVDATAHDPDAWVFYAGVVEVSDNLETTVTLYRDGVRVAEDTASEVFEPTSGCSFYVGNFRNDGTQCSGNDRDGNKFPGDVDDVRVFDRALSAAEVELLYREGDWPTTR